MSGARVLIALLLVMPACGDGPRGQPSTRMSSPSLARDTSRQSTEPAEEQKPATSTGPVAPTEQGTPNGAGQADLAGSQRDPQTLGAFEIEVRLDAAAAHELRTRSEGIEVDFGLFDSFAARPDVFRSWVGTLGPAGGVLLVPPQSLAPGPGGQAITGALINVTTARQSADDNLLDCGLWEGTIEKIPQRVQIDCVLLPQRQ